MDKWDNADGCCIQVYLEHDITYHNSKNKVKLCFKQCGLESISNQIMVQ